MGSELSNAQRECLTSIEAILEECKQGVDLAYLRTRLRSLLGDRAHNGPQQWISMDRRKGFVAEWNEHVPCKGEAIVDVLAPYLDRKFFLELMPPSTEALNLLVDHLTWPEVSSVRVVTAEDALLLLEDQELTALVQTALWQRLEAIHRACSYPPPPVSMAVATYLREHWRLDMDIDWALDHALSGHDWPGTKEEKLSMEEQLLAAIFGDTAKLHEGLLTGKSIPSLLKRNLITCLWMATSQAAGVDLKRNMRWLTELWIHGFFPLGFDRESKLIVMCGDN